MGLEFPYDLLIENANWEGLQRRILTMVQRVSLDKETREGLRIYNSESFPGK